MYDKTTKSIIHNTQQQLLLFVFIVTHSDVYAAFVYCSAQNDPANMVQLPKVF